ncbi:MAG: zf-HC2 domain-containing protein [Nitrospirota bacterium]
MPLLRLNCAEATRLLSDSLDRPLTIGQRVALRIHLLICQWCDRYGRQLRFIREAFRGRPDRLVEPDETASEALSAEAKARLKRAVADGRNQPPPAR